VQNKLTKFCINDKLVIEEICSHNYKIEYRILQLNFFVVQGVNIFVPVLVFHYFLSY
jgi:hypothetical protein